MFSKLWIINLAIAGLVAFLGVNAVREWSGKESRVSAVDQTPAATTEKAKPALPKVAQPAAGSIPPQEAFNVVVEKNLFAAEREEIKEEVKPPPPPPAKNQAKKEPEPPKLTFTLYGVLITRSYKGALLSFAEEQGQRRRPQPGQTKQDGGPGWYETGEGEGDWKIASIEKEKVLISVGGASTEVLLYDKEKPKQRTAMAAKSQGPTVVTIATQAAAPAKAAVVGERLPGKGSDTEPAPSQRVEEKRVVETKRQPGSISSRLGTGLSTRTSREGSSSSSSYSTSRTPTFMRSR